MMKKSYLILLIVAIGGGVIITLDFQVNSNDSFVDFEQKNQIEKLKDYKSSLEEVNQFNYEHLSKLEKKLVDATSEDKKLIMKEIEVLEKIIKENSDEVQKIIERIEQ